jgi:hypothetical protein
MTAGAGLPIPGPAGFANTAKGSGKDGAQRGRKLNKLYRIAALNGTGGPGEF